MIGFYQHQSSSVSEPSTELRRSSASTIRAYGAGEIKLPEVSKDAKKQYERRAPGSGGTYTMASVASFLGWTKADFRKLSRCGRSGSQSKRDAAVEAVSVSVITESIP